MNFEDELQKLKDAWAVEMALSQRYRDRQQQIQDDHEIRLKQHEEWFKAHREAIAQHDAMMVKIDEHLEEIARLLKGKLRGENGNQ
jgi:hypothetical protein